MSKACCDGWLELRGLSPSHPMRTVEEGTIACVAELASVQGFAVFP